MKNTPHRFIEVLNEVQKDFVWNKSQPKSKHSSLIGNYEEDVDISTKLTALKITWIWRLLDGNYQPQKITLESFLTAEFFFIPSSLLN